jgi:hypothetical protein
MRRRVSPLAGLLVALSLLVAVLVAVDGPRAVT